MVNAIASIRAVLLLFIIGYFAIIDHWVPSSENVDRDAQLAAAYTLVLAVSTIASIFPSMNQLDQILRVGTNMMGAGSGLLVALHWITSAGYGSDDHRVFAALAAVIALITMMLTVLAYLYISRAQVLKPSTQPEPSKCNGHKSKPTSRHSNKPMTLNTVVAIILWLTPFIVAAFLIRRYKRSRLFLRFPLW